MLDLLEILGNLHLKQESYSNTRYVSRIDIDIICDVVRSAAQQQLGVRKVVNGELRRGTSGSQPCPLPSVLLVDVYILMVGGRLRAPKLRLSSQIMSRRQPTLVNIQH